MVIRRIDPSENISLDQNQVVSPDIINEQSLTPQPKIRKLEPNERIMLDQERVQVPAYVGDPVYYPQKPENNNLSGLLKFGATDAARRAYEYSGNITTQVADVVDKVDYQAKKFFYDLIGQPEPEPQLDTIEAPQRNWVSRKLTESADQDFANANILAGKVNEINAQPTVDWEQVKQDPVSMKTLRFMAEQGTISSPEMLMAMVPILGLPIIMSTTSQSILEGRQRNLGKDPRSINPDDFLFSSTVGLASGGLERLGGLASAGLIGDAGRVTASQIPRNALESGLEEAATEAIQNPLELVGSTVGTGQELTAEDLLDSAAQGALVGFGTGTVVRTGTDSVRALKNGITQQPMDNGGVTPKENALNPDIPLLPPPTPASPPVPNRDDLARMINPDATAKDSLVVQPETVKPPISGTPEIGDTIEHVDQYGQVIEGTIDSVQEGENGQKTFIVTDAQGNQNIVFDGEGETIIRDKRPLNRDDLLSEIQRGQPKQDVAPQAETQPLIEPDIAPQDTPIAIQQQINQPEETEESLQAKIDAIRANAKRNGGWNGMLKRREQDAINKLSAFKQRQINQSALEANPEPTEAQKQAGNYKKGHVKFSGFDITIENAKGSVRKGIDSDGEAWETTMPANYGYIKRTEGADGDNVDVYIGDNPDAQEVFIVDQIDPVTGKFDEHKVMMGFNSSKEAGDAYKNAFSDGKGVSRVGAVEGMSIEKFKEWLKTSDTKKPLVYREPAPQVQESIFREPKPVVNSELETTTEPPVSAENAPTAPNVQNVQNEPIEQKPEKNSTKEQIVEKFTPFAAQFNLNGYSNKDKTAIIVSFARYSESLQQGKPDKVAARVFEAIELVNDLNSRGDDAQIVAKPIRQLAVSIARRYETAILVKKEASKALLDDEARLVKKISEAHDFLDKQRSTDTTPEVTPPVTSESTPPVNNNPKVGDIIHWQGDRMTVEGVQPYKGNDFILRAKKAGSRYDFDIPFSETDEGKSRQNQEPAPTNETSENKPSEPENVPETPVSRPPLTPDNQEAKQPTQDRGRKMQDVGEKLEGKRALQDKLSKASYPEKAKTIIEATRPKNAFKFEKQEHQTDGVVRFAQAIQDGMFDFSGYLKSRGWISNYRSKYSKSYGWEQQIANIFAEGADLDGAKTGDRHSISEEIVIDYRKKIEEAASDYIDLSSQISQMFANSSNIEQFKAELFAELDKNDSEFSANFGRFAKTYRLSRDIFSDSIYSPFAKITDDTEAKKTNRVEKTLSRPKLEKIERIDLKDHRNGRDVSEKEFMDTFGFRGVEFGEWVSSKEGQGHVNLAYDALMDLANRLNISPKHISIGGKLGFAFGSRGKGEHSAHFEPSNNVINLTKTRGDGAVSHEWFHALDHNLRKSGPDGIKFMDMAYKSMTHSPIDDAEAKIENRLKDFLTGRAFWQRSSRRLKMGAVGEARYTIEQYISRPYEFLFKRTQYSRNGDALGKDYWGTPIELIARAWEGYIYDTLKGSSPYLVSDWVAEGVVTKENGYRGTVFPDGEERKNIKEFFDSFLKSVEFTDDGVKVKEGWNLPIQSNLDKMINMVKSFEPKLNEMMKEIEDASVQQTDVRAIIPDSNVPTSPDDVSGIEPQGDFEEGDNGQGDGGASVVSKDDGKSQTEPRDGERSRADSGGDSIQRDDTVPEPIIDVAPIYSPSGTNHKIAVGALDEKRKSKQKALDNLKIIKTVKQIESENRSATPEEQILLAKYTGWGSIKNAFPKSDGVTIEDGWSDINSQLKSLLTEKEYKEARSSIQYAHYTSEIVVRSMWDAMKRFGLNKGNVFEPGMGIGNFAGMIPDGMDIQYSGLEIDPMTYRISRILYPEASVRNADFTAARYGDDTFDAAIGNPPFSDRIISSDPKYKSKKLNIHNYFFAKTLDMIAPGGVMGFVTSRYSMDSMDSAAREMLASKADLIGAIRLPNTAFKTNANTEVVTDIIFLRKRLPNEKSNGVNWLKTKEITIKDSDGAPVQVPINEFFHANPEMILGNVSLTGSMYSKNEFTVEPSENSDLQQQLSEAIASLPENVITDIQKSKTQGIDYTPQEAKEGSFYMKDGVLMQIDSGVGSPVPMRGKGAGGISKVDAEKIQMLIPVRDALRKAMLNMVNRNDKDVKKYQKELDKAYDEFVKKYGPITKSETESRPPSLGTIEEYRNAMREDFKESGEEFNEGTIDLSNLVGKVNPETGKKYTEAQIGKIRKEKREALEAQGVEIDNGDFNPSDVPDSVSIKYPNLDAFMDDPEAYDLMILEDYDENTGTAKKTDVFSKNIVAEIKKPDLKTSVDALNYSLSRMNRVDIDFMAQELGKNADSIVDELEELDLIYRIPNSDGSNKHIFVYAEEYLSGHVKDKLEYAKTLANFDPIYKRNVLALEAVQPKDIPASDINTQLGSPYFDEALIKDFMREALSISVEVNRIKSINNWTVESRDKYSPENTTIWGTQKRSATEIIESLLTRKNIQVTTKDPDGKQVVDVAETQAAQDKAKIIQEKFSEWIWKSSHADRIFRSYNDEYNNIVPRKYDGSHITTAISPQIKLRNHQKNVIWRIIQSGNTYMAHAVGAGKTLSMASAAMEMRRLGMWRKPMLVVPNHMIAQFAGEFKLAYPQANILIADEKKFHKDKRNRFVANVAKGDWDAVIMTFSSFSKIPVSAGFEAKMLDEQLDKYRFALQETQKTSGKRSSTASKIESQIKKMEERLNKLKREDVDQSFYFEQLGVDALMLDEAHNYRKLSFQTNQGTMKGVTPIGAKSSWDLYLKSKFLDTIHPKKNLVLASGTPLTNTLAEVFTIQRFMDERALKDRGLDTFDAWSSAFAASVTNPERQPSGSYKTVTRLSEFRNLGALSPMVRDFMDVVTSDELATLVNRPTMKSGSMIIRTVKPTTAYLAFQKYLESRTNAISGKRSNEKGSDNILNIIGEGRLAAIDMRLIDPTLPEEKSKLTDMVDNIYKIWVETSKDSFKNAYAGDDRPSNIKGGTQLVFSDLGVNAKSKNGVSFSAYDYIRRTLIRKGVPAKEIAFMSDYETFEDKRRLQNMVKSGEIRILIGSTRRMGTGLNVQNRLKAVHNLDAPWLPADLEQRTGRALRQGNQYKEIEIYGYGTEGSYDSTMWGMLETKAKAIIQFLKGDGDISSMRDIEETDQFRLAKAMTSGDPRVLKQAELQGDVERLSRQSRNFINEQVQIKSNIANKKAGIEKAKKYISDIEDAKTKMVRPPEGEFLMTVSGRSYKDRSQASGALDAAIDAVKLQNISTPSDGVKIGQLYGFDVKFFMGIGNLGVNYEIFLDHPAFVGSGKQWSTDDGLFSPSGSITTMLNTLNKLDKIKENEKQRIDANKREIGVLESQITGNFPKQEELADKISQLKAIDNDLKLNAPVEVTYDEYPIGYWEKNKDEMNNSAMFSIVGADEYKISNKEGKKLSPDKIIAALNKQAKKLGLPENSAVIFENLSDIKNVPNLDKASQDGGVIDGFYYKNLIYIAMTAKDYISTLNHEAVHYLKAAGAFTQAEWDTLLEKAPKWREKYNIQKNYGDLNLTESKLDEEAIAHALQDYSNQGILTRIRNKIIKYFNMVKNVVTGKGFDYKTPEALFDDIISGEIGRRRFDPNYDIEPMFSLKKSEKTNSPEFKKWFGNSKVVDADGNPMVVYHGSQSEFDSFKDGDTYFTSDKDAAASYGSGNPIEVYIKMENPLEIDFEGESDVAQEDGDLDLDEEVKFAKEEGYDGVIAKNTFDGENTMDQYVVFKPNQIKSVNNRGTFDANDERIMFSRKVIADGLQSTLVKSVKNLKQEKGTGVQMLGILKNTEGVKEEEISWTGLDDFLLGKPTVSKQEIIDYLDQNQVRIEEVILNEKQSLNADDLGLFVENEDGNWSVYDQSGDLLNDGFDYEESAKEWADEYARTIPSTSPNQTKFSQYTLPGGQNYREVLLTLPAKDNVTRDIVKNPDGWGGGETGNVGFIERGNTGADYRSSHFDQPNVLAHVRLNDRTDADGKKVLFIEEIQSDWHQAGRKKGYKSDLKSFDDAVKAGRAEIVQKDNPMLKGEKLWVAKFDGVEIRGGGITRESALENARDRWNGLGFNINAVPDAPFKKSWHEMAFRRIVQMASQQGYDSVAWTTGEQQTNRYDLSKQIKQIIVERREGKVKLKAYDLNDNKVINKDLDSVDQLEDYIGKDAAQKAIDQLEESKKYGGTLEKADLRGLDLKVGGEGMKGFYDNILVKYANKFGKKFDAKVGQSELISQNMYYETVQASENDWNVVDQDGEDVAPTNFTSEKEAEAWIKSQAKITGIHSMDITPKMREAADEGLPLFSRIGGIGKNKMTKEEQLEQAIASLDARGLADKLRPAIGKIASYVLHPHQIASLYKSFTPVYLGAIDMIKTRDVLVHKLSDNITLYNKMNKKSKARIDAVLELGRLSKQNYKVNAEGKIVVKNEGYKDTIHSKDGDTITLSDVEARAYQGVRDAMDLALDTYSRTILEEYGFVKMGLNNKQDLIKALSKEKNKSVIKQMQDVLRILQDIEDAKRKGYIPLKRWGEIGITVRTKGEDAELVHFERIELPNNKVPFIGKKNIVGENKVVIEAVKRLREKYPADTFAIDSFEVKDFTSLQAKIDLNELDVLAASSDMSEADYDTLREMISDAIKRRGFRQHFFQSNDVPGYDGDFERAINDYVVSISGHLSRRMHIPKLDAAVKQIIDSGETSIAEYATKYVKYITDPVEEFGAVRQMAYMWYLAGNIASGVTNASQPFMVTAPWFKAMFSHGQIAKQMGRAYKDATAMLSLKKGTDVFDFSKAPDDVREALKRANAEGYFIPLQTYDAMAIANSNSSYMRGTGRRVRDVMDVLSLTFSVPERTNRVVTYVSAYRFAIQPENKKTIMAFINRDQLGRASLIGKEGAEFAEAFADYAVMSTQLRMGKLNRPTLSRGVGTLPFQFMSFSLQMFELMYRLKSVHGGKGAMSVGMMMFAVVAMAGIKGIPFEDDLQKLFEAAYKKLTRTDIDLDSEMLKILTNAVGKTAAQAIVKGIPYALANVDMSGRLGYGNIVPDGQSDLLGVWFDMLYTKPTQAATDLARGDELQATANVMPAFIRNPIQAYLWATEGVKSGSTGDTIIPPEDLTKTDIGLKMLGFTSSAISGERNRVYAERRASTAVNELRSDYYDRLARAYAGRIRASRNGDKEAELRYSDEIEAINIEKNTHNEDAPLYKQIIINDRTLKQRVVEEINGAKSNKPRKQARQEAEELKKVWGN